MGGSQEESSQQLLGGVHSCWAMLMCTCGYVYVYLWIMELLQHVMVLLDNYNTLGEGSRKRSVLVSVVCRV